MEWATLVKINECILKGHNLGHHVSTVLSCVFSRAEVVLACVDQVIPGFNGVSLVPRCKYFPENEPPSSRFNGGNNAIDVPCFQTISGDSSIIVPS